MQELCGKLTYDNSDGNPTYLVIAFLDEIVLS